MSGGAGRWEQEDAHCSAESSFGWLVLSVRYGEWMRVRTQMQEGKGIFINNNINKTNKNYPIGEKTDWLNKTRQGKAGQDRTGQDRTGQDRTGQGRTGHKAYTAYNNELTRDCKHKEIIKEANEEVTNEGRQVGQNNQ